MTDTTMTQDEILAQQASEAALLETEQDMYDAESVEYGVCDGSFGTVDPSVAAEAAISGVSQIGTQEQQESQNVGDAVQEITEQTSVNPSYVNSSMVQSTMQELDANSTVAELAGSAVSQVTQGMDVETLLDSGGMKVVQAGLASVLLSKLTGNKLVGVLGGTLGTFALQKMDLLPESFSGIGDYINNVKSYFNGEHLQEEVAQQQAQDQMAFMDEQVSDIQGGFQANVGTVTMGLGCEGSTSVADAMAEGGRLAAENGAFVSAGSMDATTLQPLSQLMQANMNVFAEKAMSGENEEGQLTKEMRTDLVAECKAMQDGFVAYSDAAKEQIEAMYGSDPEMQALAMQGLSNVMQAETAPFYQTMASLDEKYHFLSEEDKSYFEGITGVTPYVESYGMQEIQTEQETSQEEYQQQMQASQQVQEAQMTEEQSAATQREVPDIVKGPTENSMSYEMY